jgi:two-component system response regulator HydG
MGAPVSGRTVLVIEDQVDYARLLRYWLQQLGYAVTHVDTLTAGLAAVTAQEFTYIFLDLHLPDAPGDVLSSLRQLTPLRQGIPILVMTGYTTNGVAGEALKYGAALFVDKNDLTPESLPTLLQAALPHG